MGIGDGGGDCQKAGKKVFKKKFRLLLPTVAQHSIIVERSSLWWQTRKKTQYHQRDEELLYGRGPIFAGPSSSTLFGLGNFSCLI